MVFVPAGELANRAVEPPPAAPLLIAVKVRKLVSSAVRLSLNATLMAVMVPATGIRTMTSVAPVVATVGILEETCFVPAAAVSFDAGIVPAPILSGPISVSAKVRGSWL